MACPVCGNKRNHDRNCKHKKRPLNQTFFISERRKPPRNFTGTETHIGAEYTAEETAWLRAISNWQTCHGRLNGAPGDDPRILQIAKALGYERNPVAAVVPVALPDGGGRAREQGLPTPATGDVVPL